MPRPIWSGAISFGLVNVPVKLYPATRSHDVRFHQLHRDTHARVRRKRVDEETGEEVDRDDIVKGYEIADGQYVVVDPEDVEAASPEASRQIDIEDFVELDQIDPLFFDRSYYLAPASDGAAKPFRLLLEAMSRTGKASIAEFVMRSKAYLAAIRAQDGVLVATTLNYADEVLDPGQIDAPDTGDVEIRDREIEMAEQLVESLTTDWEPTRYRDEHTERLLEIIRRKAEGEQITVEAPSEERAEVIDLVDALERSLSEGRRRAPGGDDLAAMSKQELYELAQERGVEGRSQMTKDELVEALRADRAA